MADYTLSAKITGDSSGFEKAFQTATGAVDSFEKKFKSIGGKISSIGDSLTKKITKPALVAGSAVAGIAIGKGFSRLVGIDDARAKLTGLGHDAQSVDTIMDSALQSVKNTSYGLDEAATTAANAVAAGIKPGQDLTKYLSMTADAAAIAGVSMSEMGSIINKVQTGQTVYTEDLEQLADRGLPVYQWIGEAAGVAASEVKKMASEGQISSEMLFSAIEKNIGGAAKTIGENSFSAAIANIGASIGRIGANFLDAGGKGGGFFSTLKPLLSDFNNSLAAVEAKATELGVRFGNAFSSGISAIQEFKGKFDALPASTQNLIMKAVGIGSAVVIGIGPALSMAGKLTSGFGTAIKVAGGLSKTIGLIASPVGLVVAVIAGLAAGFLYLMQTNEGFRAGVMALIDAVLPGIQALVGVLSSSLAPVMQTLQTMLSGIVSGIMPGIQAAIVALTPVIAQIINTIVQLTASVLPILVGLFNQLAPFLVQIASLVGQLLAQLAPIIAQLANALLPVITNVVTVVANIASAIMPALIAILNVVMSVIQAIAPVVANILSVVVSVISGIIAAVSPIISFIGGIIAGIMSVISPIVTFIANIIATAIQVIGTVVGAVSGIFATVFSIVSGVFSNISNFISTVINAISTVISTLTGIVGGVFNGIYSVVSSVMGNVRNFITGVFSGIQSAWNGLTSFVSGVFAGVGSAVQSLVSTVKGFVNGVIGGINAAIGLINMIPGVSIGKIPYLAHGTDNWQGGFAYMNEGGRGELTYLPNGAQVIPHDISIQYAKESARANAAAEPLDMSGFMEGMVIQIINNTSVDGTPLKETISDYTIRKIGNQQKAVLRAKGALA